MSEPLVQVTGNVVMTRSRYLEWLQGYRPPPDLPELPARDGDAWRFFQSGVECGMYSEDEALLLLKRHRELEALEGQEGEPGVPAEVRDWLISQGWQPPS